MIRIFPGLSLLSFYKDLLAGPEGFDRKKPSERDSMNRCPKKRAEMQLFYIFASVRGLI
jgi:hypothetical protein